MMDIRAADEFADIDQKVRAAQIQLLYRQSWTGLSGVIIVSLTACVIFWQVIPQWKLSLWAGLTMLLSLVRGGTVFAFQRRGASIADIDRWASIHVVGVIASALLWATPVLFLWPTESVPYQLAWPICILPLSAAAVATYYTWTSSYASFVIVTVVPMSFRFLYQGDHLFTVLGLLALFYIGVLLRAGRVMHAASVRAFEFGIRNGALNKDLKAVLSNREQLNVQLQQEVAERTEAEQDKEKLILELQSALDEIRTMKGIIPICMHCKGIRDDKGYWNKLEQYVSEHSHAQFSHGICESCLSVHYPGLDH